MSEADLGNLDSILRLLSIVYQFKCPEIGSKTPLSFARSFKSCGMPHVKSCGVITQADAARLSLSNVLISVQKSGSPQWEGVVRAASEYIPLIEQILVSCQANPGQARLDERLMFEWSSGIEKSNTFYKSEALMYDLVMALSCEALGNVGMACDACTAGDFTSSGRNFKSASSILQFLAEDQLPKWVVAGNTNEDKLPCEAIPGPCNAFTTYFLGLGQHMAIATVLAKPESPNNMLVAKLCFGTADLMEQFMTTLKAKANLQMVRIDPNLFTIVSFQINLQRLLSSYFLARAYWGQTEYGLGLKLMNDAIAGLKNLPGLPYGFKNIKTDVSDLKEHMKSILKAWEYDNQVIYFATMPTTLPEDKRLTKGITMTKATPYSLPKVEPFMLFVPVKESASIFGGLFGKKR